MGATAAIIAPMGRSYKFRDPHCRFHVMLLTIILIWSEMIIRLVTR